MDQKMSGLPGQTTEEIRPMPPNAIIKQGANQA
jgi:hypothetical protein